MARNKWMQQRLQNWALWKNRGDAGGLGFPKRNILASEPSGGYREAAVPIDDCDAAVTDQAVESLRASKGHLHMTLQCHYVQNLGIKGTALKMARAESTIKANLEQADRHLQLWFSERAERLRAA